MCDFLTKYGELIRTIAAISTIIGFLKFRKRLAFLYSYLKTRIRINVLKMKRGCYNCQRKKDMNSSNGRCQWQSPASFGQPDLKDCKCFKK